MSKLVTVRGVVLNKDNGVLVLQYSDKRKGVGRLWTYPGGRPEPSDADYEATLKRELQEESGLELVRTSEIAHDVLNYYLWDGKDREAIVYLAEARGQIKLNPEHHQNYNWVDRHILESLNFVNKPEIFLEWYGKAVSRKIKLGW